MADTPRPQFPDVIALVSDESIQYLPKLNPHTGSKEATILLLRVLKWWQWAKNQGKTAFWKFAGPCGHPNYKKGDSWQEELGFTRREFETALAKIGTRINGSVDKEDVLKKGGIESCVLYYTNAKRVTFYHVNERAVAEVFMQCYPQNVHYANGGSVHYPGNGENVHQSNGENVHQLSIHSDHSSLGTKESSRKPRSEPKAKKSKSKITDERRRHPSVSMVYQVIAQQPKKLFWDDIIALGDPEKKGINKLDRDRMMNCVQAFVSVGGFEGNLAVWLLDWYVNGIPEKYRHAIINPKYRSKYGVTESSSTENKGSRLRKGLNEQ